MLVFILVTLLAAGCSSATPASTSTTPTPVFSYQVRVQAANTGQNIANAKVTIDVEGKAPLIKQTDSEGFARIFVYTSHSNRPGLLIIEADGYQTYRRNIDLIADQLPSIVQLAPTTAPVTRVSIPTPSPLPTPITTERTSPPISTNNGLWINTYPAGAEVYVVPATVSHYDLELDDVIQPQNFVGIAPLTHQLATGMYYVVTTFQSDLYAAAGYSLPVESDPTFRDAFPFDGNLFHNTSFVGGKEIKSISKVYRIDIDSHRLEALTSIALPLPEDQRGQSKPNVYPTLATVESIPASFTFKPTIMKDAIEESLVKNNLSSTVDQSLVGEMVEVLLRVGKVKLDTNDIDLIIQINEAEDTFSILTYG